MQEAGSSAWGLAVAEQSGQAGLEGKLWVPGRALPSLAA